MPLLLDLPNGSELILTIFLIFVFIGSVYLVRWIFGISKIIDNLQKQNDLGLIQIRLLKKMLINQGASTQEIDEIISKGNKL